MTITVPFVHVPVSELEIVSSAGYAVFVPHRWAGYDKAGSTMFTRKTPASDVAFRRRLKFWDVRIGSFDDWFKSLEDENHKDEDVTFYCEIGGHTFFATYNLRTRRGTLKASVFREEYDGS